MGLAEPTKEEKPLLKQFRNKVEDVLHSDESKSDYFLIRWIRARDHDLEKAESMLRSSMKWRKESEVDQILSISLDPWLLKNFPFHAGSHDKLGNAVTELEMGAWDMRKAIHLNKSDELLEYITFFFETSMAHVARQNGKIKDGEWRSAMCTIIVDWEGYSYAQFLHLKAVQNILRMAATYESHYPEMLHKCFFINAPSIFPLLMAMLKTVIAPKTLSKISVFGSDRKQWEPEILSLIDPDQLGIKYGGTRAD